MKKRELASSSKLIQTAEGRHRGKTRSRNTWAALVSSPLGIALSKTFDSTGLGKKYLDQEHQSKAIILTRAQNPNTHTVLGQAFSFNHLIEGSSLCVYKNLLTIVSQTDCGLPPNTKTALNVQYAAGRDRARYTFHGT